jgi:hypothetical protein
MANVTARQAELKVATEDFQKAFTNVAIMRRSAALAIVRAVNAGLAVPRDIATEYLAGRDAVFNTARKLDKALDELRRADNQTWIRVIGDFNAAVVNVPGMAISSTSVFDIVEVALPSFDTALYNGPSESRTTAVRIETQRYAGTEFALNGLGFAPIAAGTACFAVAAGTAAVGVGIAIGVGCALLVLAVAFVAYKIIAAVVDSMLAIFAPDSLRSKTETERLKAAGDANAKLSAVCKENNLTPEQCAKFLGKVNEPPKEGGPGFGTIAAIIGLGVVAYFVLASRGGGSKSEPRTINVKALPATAGLGGRRRAHARRARR